MRCRKITITRQERKLVSKMVTVADPITKIPKDVPYASYEWVTVAGKENVLTLPADSKAVDIASKIASTSAMNAVTKQPDSNIRFDVNIETLEDAQPDVQNISAVHECPCGCLIPIETPPRNGQIYTVRCPKCSLVVLQHGGRR